MEIGCLTIVLFPILVKSQNLISDTLCPSKSSENNEARIDALKKIFISQSETGKAIHKLDERVQALETILQKYENGTCKNVEESGTTEGITLATSNPNLDDAMKRRLETTGQFGKTFYLAFPDILTSVKEIQLSIVSIADGTITITSEEPGVDQEIGISSKTGLSLTLPNTLLRTGSFVGRKTVLLQSTTDIAVFCVVLGRSGTGDGYIAVPAKSLEKKYYFSMNQNAMLSIVSFYDETLISIISNAGSNIRLQSMGLSSNANITLERGQVLQIRHTSWVMGYVLGSKPFMFLHGSHGDSGYSRYRASFIDSVFYSEARFFIIPYLFNGTDSVTFCNTPGRQSADSDRRVSTSSNYLYIKGQTKVSYIRATFQTSCHYIGHGFSVSVPPVSSFASYCRFLTPYQTRFTHHAVVLIRTENDDDVEFRNINKETDLNPINREFITVDGVSYSAIYFTIAPGQYEVYHTNPEATLGVITYGFGKGINAAYGFPVCFKKF